MFCCPYPRDSSLEPIQVPLIAGTQYFMGKQAHFSESFNLALVDKIRHAILRKKKAQTEDVSAAARSPFARAVASFIQSWLFFGLASEVLSQDVEHDVFATVSKDGSAEKYIDTRIHERYLQKLEARWKQLDQQLSAERFEAHKNAMEKKLESAMLVVMHMDISYMDLDDEDHIIAKVLLSIHMLFYIIEHALNLCNIKIPLANPTLSLTTRFLMWRMIGNGWCEKRLNLFESAPLTYPAMYFLSSCDPPRSRIEDHSRCDSSHCQVFSSLSDPIHRTAECLCKDILVLIEHVNRIIAAGGIPLVKVAWSATGKTLLEVVPYTPGMIYVAISHVWADRQFGSSRNALPKCQVKYLEEVISTIPTDMSQCGLKGWLATFQETTLLTEEIDPPSRTYSYFWLDSYCIPQAPEHADLRSQAIEMMNLIYAAAQHTLVFDKGLQALNGGRQPCSLLPGGRPTYYAPSDEHLLDVVGSIYASNWMGRSWTLQEGVLSRNVIFALNGSFAYLKTLWPYGSRHGTWQNMLKHWISVAIRQHSRDMLFCMHMIGMGAKVDERLRGYAEPLLERVGSEIYTHVKQNLHVEQYRDYTLTPVDRAARFVKAHHALQSRTTTQAEDIPLILMNMSCLNANAISQQKTADARMKRLVYSLGLLPAELLFSNCTRLGSCKVDAWISREIVKENFRGDHILKLGPLGFTFETKKGCQPMPFYLLSSTSGAQNFRLALPDQEGDKPCVKHYDVQVLQTLDADKTHDSANGWCIVVERSVFERSKQKRGARFIIDRVIGDKYLLNFDCALTLTEINTEDDCPDEIQEAGMLPSQTSKDRIGATLLNGEFILRRSQDHENLSISRPQNPEQYSDRLMIMCGFTWELSGYLERLLVCYFFSGDNPSSKLFFCFYGLYIWKKLYWIEDGMREFVHTAWMATYEPDWDPNGRWKWFWKVSNWEPPVPFKRMMKWCCQAVISCCIIFGWWVSAVWYALYWVVFYDGEGLLVLLTTGLVAKAVLVMVD